MSAPSGADRTALVTGGSRGIGRAIAERLAADGAAVAITYSSSADEAERVVAGITDRGGSAFAIRADITDLTDSAAMFESVQQRWGRLDVLVNNAGVAASGPVASTTEQAYDRLFAVTKGTFFALQHAARAVADGGRVISISTGLTRAWPAMNGAYAGSKAAIEQFSKALSKEVGARGVTVNVVLPGITETDLTSGAPQEFKERGRQMSSLGRLGQPDDIAGVVAFLASDDARWITGQLIVANGGTNP